MRNSNKENKAKILWSQQDLIDFISNYAEIDLSVVQKVFATLEEIVTNHLKFDFSSFGDNIVTTIKIFDGLTIEAEKIPEKKYVIHNKTITATPRIKARSHLSRYYVRKILNELADG